MQMLSGKRIFYIEDDVQNRGIVQVILEQSGAEMAFERWGRGDTVPRIKKFMPVDLILLDLMFPNGVTGYDVFAHIREDPSLNEIPIIAVSAADPTIEIPRAQEVGFAGFIAKPVSIQSFPAYLNRVLSGEPVWISGVDIFN